MTTIEVEETYTEEKSVTDTVDVCEHCGLGDGDGILSERGPMLTYVALMEGEPEELDSDDEVEAEFMERYGVKSIVADPELDVDAPELHLHADCISELNGPYDLQYEPPEEIPYATEGARWALAEDGRWYRTTASLEGGELAASEMREAAALGTLTVVFFGALSGAAALTFAPGVGPLALGGVALAAGMLAMLMSFIGGE